MPRRRARGASGLDRRRAATAQRTCHRDFSCTALVIRAGLALPYPWPGMNKARSHDSRQSWQWPRAIVALVLGQIAALAVMAAYAHGTAELVWPLELAPYGALAVVPVAGLAAVVGTALCLRMLRLPSRSLFSLVLALSALIGYTLATPVRLYPPAELHAQLPFYVDTTPSFGRAFAAIKDAPFPVLGAVSRPEALWIYL